MKRKYYIRGIGVGILFATIVFLVAYIATGRNHMSNEEIIKRAEALGMVHPESVLDSLDKPGDKSDDSNKKTESSSKTTENTENAEDTEDSNSTENSSSVTTESSTVTATDSKTEATTDSKTSESKTEATTESNTSSSQNSSSKEKVQFTVVSGMNSWNVATILQDHGVISSAAEFDAYLEANGYSSRIATGEYTVEKGADYESIAKMITGR